METVVINTMGSVHELENAVVERRVNGDIVINANVSAARFTFDKETKIVIPVSLLPAHPNTSLEERKRLRHACIQMAIQADIRKENGAKRPINEVALEFYNFIVK